MRNLTSTLLRFCAIVGAIPVVLALVQRGVLTVGQAAGLLVAIVIAVAMVNSVMRLILPLLGLALFITYSATNSGKIQQATGLLILTGIFLLFGLYIMIRKAFPGIGRDSNRAAPVPAINSRGFKNALVKLFAFVGAIPVAMVLVQKGVISSQGAVGLICLIAIGLMVVNSAMRWIMPVFGVALFVTYNATSNAEIKELSGSLLVLVIMLFGLFMIFRSAFARSRQKN